jgi:autotransporter-associated beta strand protein
MHFLRTSGYRSLIILVLLFAPGVRTARADDATWNLNPASNDWSNAANWTPHTVPMGGNIATFGVSNLTSISAGNVSVNGIVFNPGASAYTITGNNFTVGVVTNNSGTTQTFTGSSVTFFNSIGPNNFVGTSTRVEGNAGDARFTGRGVLFEGDAQNATITPTGSVAFSSGSAGNAVVTNNGASVAGGQAVFTVFYNSSTPANATIINNGSSVPGADGGYTIMDAWLNQSSPFTGTMVANGGTNGGSGGRILISAHHFDGGTGRLIVSSGATFDITESTCPQCPSPDRPGLPLILPMTPQPNEQTNEGIPMGSMEGGGDFNLGSRQLKVGANNLNTVVSGVLHDGSGYYIAGSLDKIGTGTLTLTNANSYTGGTIVESGTLDARNIAALGPGNISVVNPGAVLILEGDADNGPNPDTATLSIVSGCTVNLHFSGPLRRIASLVVDGVVQPFGVYGAPGSFATHQLPEFTGSGLLRVNGPIVVSRKNQGGSAFDIPLTLHGQMAVESRSSPNNAYQIVISYANPVTFFGAAVTYGVGMVTGASGNGTSTITLDLAGVPNRQAITVTVYRLNDGFTTKDLPIRMVVLIGDVVGSGTTASVDASDISAVKAQIGQPVTAANFRADVNANGSINASDTSAVKLKSGASFSLTPTAASGPGIPARASDRH